ncbi:MAG: hypothetical protein ACEY3M_13280 [Wolbachia sp.]
MAKRQPSSRYVLAAEIPRMNRGMTVRGGMTITSSSRYLLAGSRDTANESRYDGSWRYDVEFYTHQLSIPTWIVSYR